MKPSLAGHAAMFAFSALVAGSFALGALAANEISPGALNAIRFWIASGVIGIAALLTTGIPPAIWRAAWRYPVLAFFMCAYFVLMFEGLKTAQPVSAAAVFTLTPILSGLFGYLLLRQRMTPRMALALMIGAFGALWVIFRADLQAALAFDIGRGEAIYFVGCIAHAVYTPLVTRLNRGEPALHFTFGTLLAGAGLLTIWSWGDLIATDWGNLPAIVWITIIYTACFASAATFTLLQFAALRLPGAKVMAYTYLTPSWVILWQLALGQQPPIALVLVGIALTAAALALLLRDDSAARPTEGT